MKAGSSKVNDARESKVLRTAFLVDIDNICANGMAPKHMVEAAVSAIHQHYRPGVNDQIYCAATAVAAYFCKATWPGCTVRIGRGPDGSDLCLLRDGDPKWLISRFDRVVIASGDGIFATLAAELIAAGIQVEVANGLSKVSHKLSSIAPVRQLQVGRPVAHMQSIYVDVKSIDAA